jgi:hypothetical protein
MKLVKPNRTLKFFMSMTPLFDAPSPPRRSDDPSVILDGWALF